MRVTASVLLLLSRVLLAACLNTTSSTPVTISCDLGVSTVWNAGETAEVKVPVTAGLTAANNVLNTAIVSDNQGRTQNDTFPITINVDDTVSVHYWQQELHCLLLPICSS
jgi:hypothetical protein